MKLVPVPVIDNITVYRQILKNKNIVCSKNKVCPEYKQDPDNCKANICSTCNDSPRAVLKKYEPLINNQYAEYENIILHLKNRKGHYLFGKVFERQMRNAYEKSTAFEKVRSEIFNNYKSHHDFRCPFCMMSTPGTLDHYLCESVFPQFILYAPNLVPCCNDCNNSKKTELLNTRDERIFLHFYYDELPELAILECDIVLSNDVLIPKYYVNENVKDTNADIFRRQFMKLGLGKKYDESCNGKLSTLIDELKHDYREGGKTSCIDTLIDRIYSLEKNLGVNHYSCAMHRGVLKHFDIVEIYLNMKKNKTLDDILRERNRLNEKRIPY